MKLVCIPYAGGSSLTYKAWKKMLSSEIDVILIELPGHGVRIGAPLCNNFDAMVDDILLQVENQVYGSPYVLFGHSMGSTLAYELYYKIIEKKLNLPNHIIFSGRLPPDYCRLLETKCGSSLYNLKERVKELGGNTEIFEDEALCKIFVPILQSDYRILEDYMFKEKGAAIKCGISVFYGINDSATNYPEMRYWALHSAYGALFYSFPGSHFFINSCRDEVIDRINRICTDYIL